MQGGNIIKKTIAITMVLLILLTACQPVPVVDSTTAGSIPSSSSVVPPSSSTVVPPTSVPVTTPPATSIPTTNPPTTPDSNTGYLRLHMEYIGPLWDEYDLSECVIGYLYWLDKETHEVTLLLAEPLAMYSQEGSYIYYVKEADPTKVYRMLFADPSQHELVYESTHGNITYIQVASDLKDLLQFVVDEKKFVVYDMASGESSVLMGQYYINCAWMYGTGDGVTWSEIIEFEGKHTENDSPYTIYVYNHVTGALELGDE